MEKIDFADANDVVFVPREVIEAFNGIYHRLKEAQQRLHHVEAGFTPVEIQHREEDNLTISK